MKRFLITGITGFAGPHLANLLVKEGHHVSGLVRRTNGMESDILDIAPQDIFDSIEFLKGDLTNYQS
jgi:GDP-D-mannose dehydratase